jgi:hypothetical protein
MNDTTKTTTEPLDPPATEGERIVAAFADITVPELRSSDAGQFWRRLAGDIDYAILRKPVSPTITLRNHFAGLAMQVLLTGCAQSPATGKPLAEAITSLPRMAFLMADCMVEESTKKAGGQ